ncbi:TniB family NTP-binding protein [Pseudomonas sp. MAP12]|uniref:TniB family NTP-binding protein n=1 Tax=Geopseudomonas aromaticivorans TaxID=2849492 RepID=A0ABS6MUA8_9GAMM|nr:TniB family NTP-binding protein [Pseudomonas aromaticivorans]MBV2132391.1 TniB family NTP-binding protein [Pseudomonas aromaticivorans]
MSRIADQLVFHARFNSTRGHLESVLARAQEGDPQILPVVGPTRVGKTTLLELFLREQAAKCSEGREVIRVVSPKHLTGRALPDACLVGIGMSPAVFNNHVAATNALIQALRRLETRMIIFDETQHMLERGSSTTVRAAADFLKHLYDQAGVSLVLAGLPTLTGLFSANEQLADRARRPVEYTPYYWDGPDYRDFRAALAGALEYLTETGWQTFPFNDAEFAARMYVATAGRYGLINKLFMEVQAVHGGRKTAHYQEFAAAYAQVVMNRWLDFNPLDPARPIETEHMALVYTQVMREAGVVKPC